MSNCQKHYTGEHYFWERYTISPTGNDWKKGHILVDRCNCGEYCYDYDYLCSKECEVSYEAYVRTGTL